MKMRKYCIVLAVGAGLGTGPSWLHAQDSSLGRTLVRMQETGVVPDAALFGACPSASNDDQALFSAISAAGVPPEVNVDLAIAWRPLYSNCPEIRDWFERTLVAMLPTDPFPWFVRELPSDISIPMRDLLLRRATEMPSGDLRMLYLDRAMGHSDARTRMRLLFDQLSDPSGRGALDREFMTHASSQLFGELGNVYLDELIRVHPRLSGVASATLIYPIGRSVSAGHGLGRARRQQVVQMVQELDMPEEHKARLVQLFEPRL